MSLQGKVYVFVAMTLISVVSIFIIPAGYVLLQAIAHGDERITNLSEIANQYIGSKLIPLVDSAEKSIFEASDVIQGVDPINISQQSLLVSLIFIGMAFSVLVFGFLQRSTFRRLSKLVEQLASIGNVGKLTERVDVQGNDELARLSETINRMLDELQTAQKAQAESEEKYRHLVEQSSHVIYIDAIDESSSSLYFSPQIESLLGYPLKEWQSNPNKWLEIIHPEDKDRVMSYHLKSNKTLEPFRMEYRMIAQDGRIVWVRDDAVVIRDHEGKPLYWQGVLQDITEHKNSEETQRRQRDFAEALRQTGVVLNTSLDINAVLDLLLEEIGRVVPYDSGCVMLVSEETARIVRMRGYENFGVEAKTVVQNMRIDMRSSVTFRKMFESGSPLIIDDTQALSNGNITVNPQARSWAGAPMISQGQLFGFISLDKVEVGYYQAEHADRLAIFAAQAALALQNARLFEVVQCHAEENRKLREATSVVTSALELDQVLEHILTQLERVLPYDSAAIYLAEGSLLRYAAGKGFPEKISMSGTTISINNELVEEARCLSAPIVIRDAQNDPRYAELCGVKYTRGWLGAPLLVRGELIGFLTVDNIHPDVYGETENNLAWTFAQTAAIAIDNARLFKQVHQLAITDALTGIFNRRHFFELASREFERARRFYRPLTLVMCDIDHFKSVNDTYGHLIGDQVLHMVAERFRRNLREVDLLGRYGGEEFVALLTEVDCERGSDVGERLRAAIEAPAFRVEDQNVSVSISVGVADIKDCPNLEILLDRADQALYEAKQNGRNRVGTWINGERENEA
jgi:diguanylate cyclase (GGDEF)-like protein/PAS domain S-box-containing protein